MSTSMRFTTADLAGLPDPLDDTRYEIIDGELYVATQPQWHHQYACSEVVGLLRNWNRETGLGVAVIAPGLVFAGDDNVAPDVVWVSRERLPALLDESGHLRAAPDLVVEVLSPGASNEQRDRDLKLKLYSRQGVREYWIIDWRTKAVHVFRRVNTALALVATFVNGDTLFSPLLPGFSCLVATFWDVPY